MEASGRAPRTLALAYTRAADGRPVGSPFYAAEQEAIKEMKASEISLKKFKSGETVSEMRNRVKGSKGGC